MDKPGGALWSPERGRLVAAQPEAKGDTSLKGHALVGGAGEFLLERTWLKQPLPSTGKESSILESRAGHLEFILVLAKGTPSMRWRECVYERDREKETAE